MSTTPNLLIPLVAQSQNNKEISFNSAIVTLDEALCGNSSVALSGSTFNLPQLTFLSNFLLKFTGALSGNITIVLPAGCAKPFAIQNLTTGGHTLTFEVGTNAETQAFSDGNVHLLYSDGVANVYACP